MSSRPRSLLRLGELVDVAEAAEVLLEQVGVWAQRDEDPADDDGEAAAEVEGLPVLAPTNSTVLI